MGKRAYKKNAPQFSESLINVGNKNFLKNIFNKLDLWDLNIV